MKAAQSIRTKGRLIGMLITLVVEFILGVSLTTVVNYDPSKHGGVQSAFLIAHIIVAIGLLIGAVTLLISALRWRALRAASAIGLLSLLGAFASGGIAVKNGAATAIFLMALFFIAALVAYGQGLFSLIEGRGN